MTLPFKLDAKTVTLAVSLLLNILGGTGTVEPVVGGPVCPPAPAEPLPPALPLPTSWPATPPAN